MNQALEVGLPGAPQQWPVSPGHLMWGVPGKELPDIYSICFPVCPDHILPLLPRYPLEQEAWPNQIVLTSFLPGFLPIPWHPCPVKNWYWFSNVKQLGLCEAGGWWLTGLRSAVSELPHGVWIPVRGTSMCSGCEAQSCSAPLAAISPETGKSDGGTDVNLISLVIFAIKWAFLR